MGAHAVLIVLDHIDNRQFPKLCHVKGFVDLALIGRAVAEKGQADLAIAAIFEIAGAMFAGGDVVSTIKKGIIDPALIADPASFVWLKLVVHLNSPLNQQ